VAYAQWQHRLDPATVLHVRVPGSRAPAGGDADKHDEKACPLDGAPAALLQLYEAGTGRTCPACGHRVGGVQRS